MLPDSLALLLPDGTIKRILLEDYLRGVVAAALVADAPLEAMKALAVAGRTFAANTHRHTDRSADVCTTRHCQAWNERANPRAARAVMETRGIVATFNDNLIEAFYFDHCDGKTRDAKGVLMDAPAYLKGVPCVCGFASLKGHGIGMCQRGMVAMARFGEPYGSILQHYYSGITLAQRSSDPTARVQEPIAPPRRARPDETTKKQEPPRRPTAAKPIIKPVSRTEPTKPTSTGANKPVTSLPELPPTETFKPASTRASKPITPRRSSRQKIEQPQPKPPENKATAPPPPPEPTILLEDAHSPETDDLLTFLAVEDVAPPQEKPRPSPNYRAARTQLQAPPQTNVPPPPSMPEDLPGAPMNFDVSYAFPPPVYTEPPPPFSMPEELPSAGNLDFLAPPTGAMPEEFFAGTGDFRTPPASSFEADLADFMPPVEKFYTPLDAPPSMPEGVPSFANLSTDETPISWAAPPPLNEQAETETVAAPRILMDALPGPRIIAGNLPKAGMLITIRDARGNSIVTVSGVAKQYGGGGFEAPLTDDGAYHVKFDSTELDLNLQNETIFIYYQ